ncbi:MAG: hypothetical protein ABI651_13510, partial [Verrucomicrobiota bacterium]
MLLVDEIFAALRSRVADVIAEINATTERFNAQAPDLTPLIDFVAQLSGIDGTTNEFTSFILPGGSHNVNGKAVPVDDPYNLYFTPDGASAIVVAEKRRRIDFLDPATFERTGSVDIGH